MSTLTSKIPATVSIATIDASGSGKNGWHSAYKIRAGVFDFLNAVIIAASVPKIDPAKNFEIPQS